TLIDQFVMERVTRSSLHDVRLGLFISERNGGDHVSSQINAEDSDGSERKGNTEEDVDEEGRDLENVGSESVGDGLLEVIED
ncbi:hypothetical protein PENTCL1PPCAC_8015, partial [Pristionchus entomophagus]